MPAINLIIRNINQIHLHFLTIVNANRPWIGYLYFINKKRMKINHKTITGISLVLMAITAIIAMTIPDQLTLRITCWTIIILLDVIAAWGLYFIFREVNKDISSLAALIRLFYAGILAIATSTLIIAKTASSS